MQNVKFKMQNFSSSPPHPFTPSFPLVGREIELAQLQKWLDNALSGERQVVFVSGEPGIGKTTLVDAFLEQVQSKLRASLGPIKASPKSRRVRSPESRIWGQKR